VFHAAMDELDRRDGRATCGSVLAPYKDLLHKYDLLEHWEDRSSLDNPRAWKSMVARKVKSQIALSMTAESQSSSSIQLLARLHPSLLSPSARLCSGPDAASSDNFHGHWLKRMLRTNSLPLLVTLGKLGGWPRDRMECVCCSSGVIEDVDHFLHCPGRSSIWSVMMEQLRGALSVPEVPAEERSLALRVVSGVSLSASTAVLLGCPVVPIFNRQLRRDTLAIIDRVVCFFLKKCWLSRVSVFGGVPMPGSRSDLSCPFILSPSIWPPIRSRS
jgi:hypothetical protein